MEGRGRSVQSKWNLLLCQNEEPYKMKYFILGQLWCFYFAVKIEWKCHFPTQSFIWQLYGAICKIFTFPSWHFEKSWLRVCFSQTSRSDHVQSCFALFPQLWVEFLLQCPQEPGKNFSVHNFHFPPSSSSSWWIWMVPGKGQSFCMLWPILWVSGGLSQPFPWFCDSCFAGVPRAKGNAVFES